MQSDLVTYLASDNYIIVNKTIIKAFGMNEAVLLGELCSEYKYWEKENKLVEGMFFSTIENIEENTGLTAHEQRQAIKSLENAGILSTCLKGVPARKYFKLDLEPVIKILITSNEKFSHLDIKKVQPRNNKNNNKEKESLSKDKDNQVETLLKDYHEFCFNLPKVRALTDKRRKAIQNILKKHAEEEVVECFKIANESSFLTGDNDRGWKADLDFLLREDKFVNILEGKYGGKKRLKSVAKDTEHLSLAPRADKEKGEVYEKF